MESRVCLHFAVAKGAGPLFTRHGQICFDGVDVSSVSPACPQRLADIWTSGVHKVNHALSCVSFLINPSNRRWISKVLGMSIKRVQVEMDMPGSGICPLRSYRDISDASEIFITLDFSTELTKDGYQQCEGILELLRSHVMGIELFFTQEFQAVRECLKEIRMPQHLPVLQLLSDARPVMNMAVGSPVPLKEYACGRTFTDDPFPSDWKALWYKHVLSLRMTDAFSKPEKDLSSDLYGLNTYYAIQRVTNDTVWNFLTSNPKSRYNKEVIMQGMKDIRFRPVASSPDSDDDGIGPDE